MASVGTDIRLVGKQRTGTRAFVRAYLPFLFSIVAIAAVLWAAQLAWLSLVRPPISVPLDSREADLLFSGVHAAETDNGQLFRWSSGDAALRVPLLGISPATVFSFQAGAAVPQLVGSPLELAIDNRSLAQIALTEQMRTYRVLVPQTNAQNTLFLHSAAVTLPPDPRQVSLRIEQVQAFQFGELVLPALPITVVQTTLLLLCGALISQVGRRWHALAGVAFAALGLALGFALIPLLYATFLARLATAVLVLYAATALFLPAAEHWVYQHLAADLPLRALWAAMLFGILLRLVGALYPLFTAYDLHLNLERFLRVGQGTLISFNESFEFQGGITVYPPGPYLLLLLGVLPGFLPPLIIQVGMACFDGASVFFVGLLARRFGARPRAAVLAALLAAALPISLTSLYYGHTAQIFGQALMLPLALLLMAGLKTPANTRLWLGAGVLFCMALLTHIGVAVLAVAWLGLLWLLIVRRVVAWRSLTVLLLAGGLLALALVYGPVVGMHLAQLQAVGSGLSEGDSGPAYNLIAKAYWIAYTPLGLLLLPLGAGLLWPRMNREARLVVASWVVSAAVFAAVELVTGLQVRFLVFAAPLAAIAAAVVLERVASRSLLGRWLAVAVVLLWVFLAALPWYTGTFANIAPSMIPLLR